MPNFVVATGSWSCSRCSILQPRLKPISYLLMDPIHQLHPYVIRSSYQVVGIWQVSLNVTSRARVALLVSYTHYLVWNAGVGILHGKYNLSDSGQQKLRSGVWALRLWEAPLPCLSTLALMLPYYIILCYIILYTLLIYIVSLHIVL